jgi:hypoxanthine phosphoribosyltransferase
MMEKLIEKIVSELKDYRIEDNHGIKSDNISLWINQFNEDDRVFILEEMLNIFQKRYCTKNEGIKFLKDTIDVLTKHFKYDNTTDFLNETELLSLQELGKSQTKFLKLLKDVLKTDYAYNYDDRNVGTIKNYLYIDDILCTGNTLYQDIYKWLNEDIDGKPRYQNIEENGSRLIFAYIFIYQKNYWKKIGQLKRNFNQRIANFISWFRWLEIDNNSNKPASKCEIVKPIEEGLSEKSIIYKSQICKSVDEYVDGKYETEEDFFRPPNIPIQEDLFTSKENRIRLERIFLEKGIEILENTETVSKQQMRALGYSLPSYKDFGFGALCFTWRNVPNNTPLVFWYAGGGFVPFFDKNIYEQDMNARIAAILNKK